MSNSGESQLDAVGRYWHNGGGRNTRNGDASAGTAKVGSYVPNAWGLYDMHGNVSELCFDWHGIYPLPATDPRGLPSGWGRVLRGGCWYSLETGCHSACRTNFNSPSDRDNGVGFRVARTLPTGSAEPTLTIVNDAGGSK